MKEKLEMRRQERLTELEAVITAGRRELEGLMA
jgi:hypothetical protein